MSPCGATPIEHTLAASRAAGTRPTCDQKLGLPNRIDVLRYCMQRGMVEAETGVSI
jgi:hypothetical protein